MIGSVLAATLAVLGATAAVILWWPGARDVALTALAWGIFAQALAVMLTVHLCLRRFKQTWRSIGFGRPSWRLLHLLWQIPAGLVLLLVVQAVVLLLVGENTAPSTINDIGAQVPPVAALAVFVAVAFLTPIWEEAVFRGVIYGGFRRRFGPWAAAVFSALIFAAAHGLPILLPYLVTLGLILAYLYNFYGSLWGSTAFHMTINAIASSAIIAALV